MRQQRRERSMRRRRLTAGERERDSQQQQHSCPVAAWQEGPYCAASLLHSKEPPALLLSPDCQGDTGCPVRIKHCWSAGEQEQSASAERERERAGVRHQRRRLSSVAGARREGWRRAMIARRMSFVCRRNNSLTIISFNPLNFTQSTLSLSLCLINLLSQCCQTSFPTLIKLVSRPGNASRDRHPPSLPGCFMCLLFLS